MAGLARTRVTPNMLTAAGVTLCALGAVLVYFEYRNEWFFFFGGLAFVVGSILDILDGALARAGGKGTPFGAFLDSTLDRVSEAFMLGAIALVLVRDGSELGVGLSVAAIAGSFLVSYTRARAEALGLSRATSASARAPSGSSSSRSASRSRRGACSPGRSTSSPRPPGSPSLSGSCHVRKLARTRIRPCELDC